MTHTEETQAMELFNNNIQLIEQTIQRRWNEKGLLEEHGVGRDDLEQYGRIGLHKACETYDPTKNSKFQTWAINNIMWAITVEIKRDTLGCDKKYELDLVPRTSLDKKLSDSPELDGDLNLYDLLGVQEEGYRDIDIPEMFKEIKDLVGEQVYEYVRLRIEEGMTHVEIGKRFNLSRTSIRNSLFKYEEEIKAIINSYMQ